jgi:2-pyrone-4,6-dicarboxylate lactonase
MMSQNASLVAPCTPPAKPLPAGAWDSHAHVFGPIDAFPLLPERRYEPPLSTRAQYLAMLDAVGFAHGVVVHPSAYSFDNSCTEDALAHAPGRLYGVALVTPEIDDGTLDRLDRLGVRSVRFTETGPRAKTFAGSLSFDDLDRLAPRLRARGWHADVWANCAESVAAAARLAAHDLPVVFDHMGYFDLAAGPQGETFQAFLSMLGDGDFWVKMTPIRLSKGKPTDPAVRPFHDLLLEHAPDRALFGSDWPYLSMDDARPDTGRLVNLFDVWTPDDDLRRRVFVDNPRRLYRPTA